MKKLLVDLLLLLSAVMLGAGVAVSGHARDGLLQQSGPGEQSGSGEQPAPDQQPEPGQDGQGGDVVEPDQLLQAWVLSRRQPDEHYSAFAKFRRLIFGSRRPRWVDVMDPAMRNFTSAVAPTIENGVVDDLLASGLRRRKASGRCHELLPWLLLAKKADQSDLRVRLLLCEAWGMPSGVSDVNSALAECEVLVATLSKVGKDPVPPAVGEFLSWLPESASFQGQRAGLAWCLEALQVARNNLQSGDRLQPRWLASARVTELDRAYEQAVRSGNSDKGRRVVASMMRVEPNDPSYKLVRLMWVMSAAGSSKEAARLAREYVKELARLPDDGPGLSAASVRQRLQRLGVVQACAQLGLDLDSPDEWLRKSNLGKLAYTFPAFSKLRGKKRGFDKRIKSANKKIRKYEGTLRGYQKQRKTALNRARVARTGLDRSKYVNQARSLLGMMRRPQRELESGKRALAANQAGLKTLLGARARMESFRLGDR